MQFRDGSLHAKRQVDLKEKIAIALDKAILLDKADKGNIQLFDANKNALHIVVHKGFDDTFIKTFKEVKPFDPTACGRAIGIGSPVIISDIMHDVPFAPLIDSVKTIGFRAVKSIPIITSDHKRLGVISTHFKEKKLTWDLGSLEEVTAELLEILSRMQV